MHDLDRIRTNAIEDQVIANRTFADAEMLVARYQRIATRRLRQGLALFSQLLDKTQRDFDILAAM
jgi:hypothetical protein